MASRPDLTVSVENPATGETLATVPSTTSEQISAAVDRARALQPEWSALGFQTRAKVMDRARRWLIANRREMVQTLVAKPVSRGKTQ